MKRYLFTLILILSCVQATVYAQKISWGKAFAADKSYSPIIIEEEGDFFYTYDYSSKELLLEKFDKKNSSAVYSKKYEIPKRHEFELIAVADKKVIVFFSFYDSKKSSAEIYCNTYSTTDGVILESNHTISSVPSEDNRDYNGYSFSVYKSDDNKWILVTNRLYTKKEDVNKTYFILLNEKLSKIFEKTENTGKDRLILDDMIIGNDGSCYFQKTITGGDGTKLVSLDADKSFKEYEYGLDEAKLKVPQNASIRFPNIALNKKGELVLVSQYVKDRVFSGYFFVSIDTKTKKIVSSKINEFDDKLVNQFRTEREIEKGKKTKVPEYFTNIHFIAKEDGGMIGITGGVQRIITQTRTTNQQGFSSYDQIGDAVIYHNVMALNFSSDGTLLWANRIPRYQSYSSRRWWAPRKNADYLSSFSVLTNDKLYIAYHDHLSNLALKSDSERVKGFRMSKKAVVELFTIDLKTGQKDKRQFTEGADAETFLEPAKAFQKSQNSDMIILGSKKTKFKFGVMSFAKS